MCTIFLLIFKNGKKILKSDEKSQLIILRLLFYNLKSKFLQEYSNYNYLKYAKCYVKVDKFFSNLRSNLFHLHN